MPRRLVPLVPEVHYHIYNRGNNRQAIFFEPDNYVYFLGKVEEYLLLVLDVLAYCLMPTHFHMLVRARAAPEHTSEVLKTSEVSSVSAASIAMMRLSVSYTKAINKRFNRVGSLFQAPFRAIPIEASDHLLNLCRYIHANPVKDGLVTDPASWPYSNYAEWLGERQSRLVDPSFIDRHFGSASDYRDFVALYLRTRDLPSETSVYLASLEH